MGKLKNVFVSFSRRDEAAGRSLIEELRRHYFSVSGEVGDFNADVDWQKAVEEAIRSAEAVILLLGSSAAPTKHQELEWSITLESHWADPKKLLIPVLLGDASLPSFVANFQAFRLANADGGWGPVIQALIQGQVVEANPIVVKDTAKLRERLKSVEEFAQSIKKTNENAW